MAIPGDRRRAPRTRCLYKATIDQGGFQLSGRVINLSEFGAYLASTDLAVKGGAIIGFQRDGHMLRISGRVTRINKAGGMEPAGFAVEFERPLSQALDEAEATASRTEVPSASTVDVSAPTDDGLDVQIGVACGYRLAGGSWEVGEAGGFAQRGLSLLAGGAFEPGLQLTLRLDPGDRPPLHLVARVERAVEGGARLEVLDFDSEVTRLRYRTLIKANA